MNSPFANLLLAMQAKIAADVTDIKFIDQDFGQLEQDNPPVLFPCVLIDFSATQFDQLQLHQDGNAKVVLRIAKDTVENSSQNTDLSIREDALEFYELEQQLYECFQTWNNAGALANPFIRKTASTEKREDRLRVRVVEFECTFVDSSVTS